MGWCWAQGDPDWWQDYGCVYQGWGWQSCWAKDRPGCAHKSYYCWYWPECNIGPLHVWDPICGSGPASWFNPRSDDDTHLITGMTFSTHCDVGRICGDYAIQPCCFPSGTEGEPDVCEMMESAEACEECGGWPHPDATSCSPDPCGGTVPCCLPDRPYGCTLMDSSECLGIGGIIPEGASSCVGDPCNTACCLRGFPNDTRCWVTPVQLCINSDHGEPQWGVQSCDPNPCEPDGACCLCRQQCLDLTETLCTTMGGAWHRGTTCASYQESCPVTVKPPCRHARFSLSRDTTSGPMESLRYRPVSIDLMNPHEYERGPEGTNCRNWWGNVSAAKGAWACGQWNKDNPATKQYVPLQVNIDPVTGMGSFWTSYRPVCPEYEQAGVN